MPKENYKMIVACENCGTEWELEFPYGKSVSESVGGNKVDDTCPYCGCREIITIKKPKK